MYIYAFTVLTYNLNDWCIVSVVGDLQMCNSLSWHDWPGDLLRAPLGHLKAWARALLSAPLGPL